MGAGGSKPRLPWAAPRGAAAEAGVGTTLSRPSRVTVLRKPWACRKSTSFAGSLSRTTRASSGSGSGASSRRVTSWRDMRAASACSISRSRRLDGFIAGAAARMASRSPNSVISWAAVLGPMPGTPGTLSTLSPIRAWASISFSGPTPNFSITSAMPMGLFFIGSCMATPGRISCIRSLSDETMMAEPPASVAALA